MSISAVWDRRIKHKSAWIIVQIEAAHRQLVSSFAAPWMTATIPEFQVAAAVTEPNVNLELASVDVAPAAPEEAADIVVSVDRVKVASVDVAPAEPVVDAGTVAIVDRDRIASVEFVQADPVVVADTVAIVDRDRIASADVAPADPVADADTAETAAVALVSAGDAANIS